MEHLKEVIDILSKKRLDKVELIDQDLISTENSLMSKLYEGIKNGDINDDQEGVTYVYGKTDQKNNQNYRRLKSRLAKRIYNTLFFIDMNMYSTKQQYERIVYEQKKVLATINILKRLIARESVIKIIKDNFQTAEAYHLYEMLKIYAYELALHYSTTTDGKKFLEFHQKFIEFSDKERLVQEATLEYYGLQLELHFKKGAKKLNDKQKQKLLEEKLIRLREIRTKVYSYETEYYYLRSALSYYEHVSKPVELLQVADEVRALTTQRNFSQDVWQGIAALYRAKAQISLGLFDDALLNIKRDIDLFTDGGLNWLTALEFAFRIALHQRDCYQAEGFLLASTNHRAFKSKPEYLTQKWHILKTYLLLAQQEIIDGAGQKKQLRLAKLINDTPYYVNDKSGYFLAIRILEMVEAIRSSDYDQYIDKVQLVKRYKLKYLKDTTHERERLFVDLLFSVEKHQFKKMAVAKAGQKSFLILKNNPQKRLLNDYEILPYHILWEIILNYLD
jgi:hypothetical protein